MPSRVSYAVQAAIAGVGRTKAVAAMEADVAATLKKAIMGRNCNNRALISNWLNTFEAEQ